MMAPPLGAEFSRHPMERLQLSPVMVRWRGDDGGGFGTMVFDSLKVGDLDC